MATKLLRYTMMVAVLSVLPMLSVSQTIELSAPDSLTQLPSSFGKTGPYRAVAFLPDGQLLLLDASGMRIIRCDANGLYLNHTGGFGFGETAFHNPTDLTVAGFEIWVTDDLGRKVVRFDYRFTPLGIVSEVTDNGRSLLFDRPVSTGRSPRGDFVVLDASLREAMFIDSEGRLIEVFASYGRQSESLQEPERVEISAAGRIAIADPGKHAVLLYDKFGTFKSEVPYPLDGSGPQGIAWQGESLWMCGESGVAAMDSSGKFISMWPAERFGFPPVDIAVQGNRVAIVGTGVRVFTINRGRSR